MEIPKEPSRSFQVIKTAPLGWFTLTFLVLPTGGSHPPSSSPNPSYHTNRLPPNLLPWRWWIPPSMLFYDGAVRQQTPSEETLVGGVVARGGGGWKGVNITVDVAGKDGDPETRGTTVVTQKGWERLYDLPIPAGQGGGSADGNAGRSLVWKGTMQAIRQIRSEDGAKTHPRFGPCNGNLKLVEAENPEQILAIWENRTDWTVLGNLLIYGDFEGRDLEMVILSCMGVVCCERITGRGVWGGIFKR
ncbi:hypothetical protein GP486_006516 [Trichoglossum hirsutum]|uniref:Uncharacterized protein n=1 Tax=Trichoglossum hirsutum TaxID=265104 RepID=A0A9P8IDJ6_9PEZI|nr:hypothetical protein GP486_006516 [Trichoglossum hirsutum]